MTDKEIKQHVENALDWEPSLDASDIGVSVDEGVVTLRGNVGSYAEKVTAERVTLRIYGVKGIANDLAVHLVSGYQRTDTEIAQAVVAALKWNTMIPDGRVTVTVANGWVTLNGKVDWQYQKDAANRAVRDLTGVRGVTNDVLIQPLVRITDIEEKIETAFTRSAEIEARRLSITAHDGKVTLTGNVHSWAERQEAERVAWAAPGVTEIDNELTVVP